MSVVTGWILDASKDRTRHDEKAIALQYTEAFWKDVKPR